MTFSFLFAIFLLPYIVSVSRTAAAVDAAFDFIAVAVGGGGGDGVLVVVTAAFDAVASVAPSPFS